MLKAKTNNLKRKNVEATRERGANFILLLLKLSFDSIFHSDWQTFFFFDAEKDFVSTETKSGDKLIIPVIYFFAFEWQLFLHFYSSFREV